MTRATLGHRELLRQLSQAPPFEAVRLARRLEQDIGTLRGEAKPILPFEEESSNAAYIADAQVPQSPDSTSLSLGAPSDHLRRRKVVSNLVLGFGTLVLSAVIGFATLHDNRQAARLQIQSQVEARELQRRATAAQILVDQLPTIVGGSEEERNLTLKLLEIIDPELVREIGERLLARAETTEEMEAARDIIASSVGAAQERVVSPHLENARKLLDLRVFPGAAREFMKAYEALSVERRDRIAGQATYAQRLYHAGEFEEAARAFSEAFQELGG